MTREAAVAAIVQAILTVGDSIRVAIVNGPMDRQTEGMADEDLADWAGAIVEHANEHYPDK